jgi:NOL1/NOP2/sun family putative RNA methylase
MTIPKRFKQRYGPLVDDPSALFDSLLRAPRPSFRINTLKSTGDEVLKRFEKYGIEIRPVPWYPDAFVAESALLGNTLERFLGKICFQELASMLPPLIIREELGRAHVVLDACAAPGSKTTQLAALMGNRAVIVANDVNYSRIRALKFNLNKAGVVNVLITNRDLLEFPPVEFDVALLDTPCSSEGTVRKNQGLLQKWNEKIVSRFAERQRKLILKAFDLLAPGGVLIYSTCTFAPEENEGVIDWLLQNRPARLLPIDLPNIKLAEPVTEWQGMTFNHECRHALRVWPHHNDTDGFFIARIQK